MAVWISPTVKICSKLQFWIEHMQKRSSRYRIYSVQFLFDRNCFFKESSGTLPRDLLECFDLWFQRSQVSVLDYCQDVTWGDFSLLEKLSGLESIQDSSQASGVFWSMVLGPDILGGSPRLFQENFLRWFFCFGGNLFLFFRSCSSWKERYKCRLVYYMQ